MLGSRFTQRADVTGGHCQKNAVNVTNTGHVDFYLKCLVISNADNFVGPQIN